MQIPFSTLLLLTMLLAALADERFGMRAFDGDLNLRKFEFLNLFSSILMVFDWKALCFRCCINFIFRTFSLIKLCFGGASAGMQEKIHEIQFRNDSEEEKENNRTTKKVNKKKRIKKNEN